MEDKPIYVTQPYLPPLDEFVPSLREIWDKKCLTNFGPYLRKLEAALTEHLSIAHINLVSNGTAGLVAAIRALEISGEVITTPYSFVATSHSLLWNNVTPVFVDVSPDTLNIDPSKIEAAITEKTTAILAVHCYGLPCDVDAIEQIASRHRLKVIYDAAHAFGVKTQGRSILDFGDLSVLSFHATKVFNTFEGGAVISHDIETKQKIDRFSSFGYEDEVTVSGFGTNCKMSEFNAALGLLQLQYIDDAIGKRKKIDESYHEGLKNISGISTPASPQSHMGNYSYFPILIEESFPVSRDRLYQRFKQKNIHVRKYFFPLISDFPMYRHLPSSAPENLPVANNAAKKVLCLPIYPTLQDCELQRVLDVLHESAHT